MEPLAFIHDSRKGLYKDTVAVCRKYLNKSN